MGTTLIAYVTKTGTTREIALEIEKTLKGSGWEARALPVSEISSLSGYSSVVLGAPINGMRLVPEASGFVSSFRDALRSLPVALFAVSYMHGRARAPWNRAIEKSVDSTARDSGARTKAIFGGRVDSELPGPARFLFGLPKGLAKDTRDWEAVRAWAGSLPGVLG